MAECPNCGWNTDQPLSRIDVEANASEVIEGTGEVVGEPIVFTLTRTGPSNTACSVDVAWSGTAVSADWSSVTGASKTLAWEAGETADKLITLVVNPDDVAEPNETVIVTLRNPNNCVLGASTASVIVANDDVAAEVPSPPSDVYDGKLPYGGFGIGTPCLLGQPGNQQTFSSASIMMRCEYTGQITHLAWSSRFDSHNRTGYSKGNGGIISWMIRKLPNASLPAKPGEVLATTRKITDPVLAESWRGEYEAAGGKGAVPGWFCEMPTIRLLKPVDVRAGEMLLLTNLQHDATRGSLSLNHCYSTSRLMSDWAPFPYHKDAHVLLGSGLSTFRPQHFPCILMGYSDGMVKGTGIIGYAAGLTPDQESVILNSATRARQVFVVPNWADGRSIKRVVSFFGRYSSGATGELCCRIRLKDDSSDGTVLAASSLPGTQVAYRPKPKTGDPTKLLRHDFQNPVQLKAGQTMYIEMSASGGSSYICNRMTHWLDYAPVGLQDADWALKGMEGQRNTGSGWQSLSVAGVKHDIAIWCEF